MSITYRLATKEDVPAAADLGAACIRLIGPTRYTAAETYGWELATRVNLWTRESRVFLALDGERVVGCRGWYRYQGVSRSFAWFVDPAYQGQGIGVELRKLVEQDLIDHGIQKDTAWNAITYDHEGYTLLFTQKHQAPNGVPVEYSYVERPVGNFL